MTLKGHTLRPPRRTSWNRVSRFLGNPAHETHVLSRSRQGEVHGCGDWGTGRIPRGLMKTSERSLFRVLEAKNAHRNDGYRARRSSGVSKKSRSIVMLLVVAAVAVGIGGYATFAGAVDTSVVFQLDGNSADPNRLRRRLMIGIRWPGGGGSAKSFSGIVPDGTGSIGYGVWVGSDEGHL